MASSACNILSPLANLQVGAITSLNKKLVATQHLAALLEQLGDSDTSFISGLAGTVSTLPAVTSISQQNYEDVLAACPALNIPNILAGAAAGVTALQTAVTQAYNSMASQLLKHPYNRMASLQSQMDKFVQQVTQGIAGGASSAASVNSGALSCLMAACGGALTDPAAQATAGAQLNAFQQNFVTGNGQVLSSGQQSKATKVTNLITQLQGLGATAGVTYAASKFAMLASQTSPGTFNSALNYSYTNNSTTIVVNGQVLNYRGVWSADATYADNDVVTFDGVLYLALQPSMDVPPTNG